MCGNGLRGIGEGEGVGTVLFFGDIWNDFLVQNGCKI